MIRHLSEISSVPTSHGSGQKRVLLSSKESGCSLTQIAVTELKEGEVAVAHVHPDTQEGFFILEGILELTLDGKKTIAEKDDFVYVKKGTSHELRGLTPVKLLTVGCVVESSEKIFYPMLFKKNHKTLVWGTEDWTVSEVPDSVSEVENGTWARYSLSDVISRFPVEILGKDVAEKYGNSLPLLTKVIDARRDLSIQVHPDDEMAQREHGKRGKSEMWYVLDAEPGACLYAGFKEKITKEEYLRRVADGTITDVLARHEVSAGDVFYLPAGRVHAICGGIRLVEVQQSSDVTYRIFDYNRPGLDGRPRELHNELAAQAIDFTVYPEYKTEHREKEGAANEILNTPYFSVRVVESRQSFHRDMIKYGSFVILQNLGGRCCVKLRSRGAEVELPEDQACLIPSAVADYDIIPVDGKVKVLESFINNKKSIGRIISDFFHLN